MRKLTACTFLMLVMASGSAFAGSTSTPETLRSTYIGERSGFTIHSIAVPRSDATIETFTDQSGVTLLVASSKATGRSQSFVLQESNPSGVSRSGPITTQAAGDGNVELVPLVERPDGSAVYSVRLDGRFIGFMTVTATGVWNFIAVNTNPV